MRFRDRTRTRSSYKKRSGYRSFKGSRSSGRKFTGQYIDPAKFVNKAVTPTEEVSYQPKHRFSDFNFDQALANNLAKRNFSQPTPIQDQVIPLVMAGRDTLGLANTGTGKTAAFLLPILNKIISNRSEVAFVVAPTRELAIQINDEFKLLVKGMPIWSAICVGGMGINRQRGALARRPQIIIGTPGRLKDLLDRGWLRLDSVKYFVLDEVDRMLDMGFVHDIQYLIDKIPTQRQTICMSATMTPAVEKLLDKLLVNPAKVSVKTADTSKYVEQDVVRYQKEEDKLELLLTLTSKQEVEKTLVFCQTKRGVRKLTQNLVQYGVAADEIHGNKSQSQRARALQAFKNGRVTTLVATDVAARGLDIPGVSHVINFDLPMTYADYTHRIGRTGRAGKRGIALTFVRSN